MGIFMVCFIVFIILLISSGLFYMLFTVGRGIDVNNVNNVNKDSKVNR